MSFFSLCIFSIILSFPLAILSCHLIAVPLHHTPQNDELDELRETSTSEKDGGDLTSGDLTSIISKLPPRTLDGSLKEAKTDKPPVVLDAPALPREDPAKLKSSMSDSAFEDGSSSLGILEEEKEEDGRSEDLGLENSAMSVDDEDGATSLTIPTTHL